MPGRSAARPPGDASPDRAALELASGASPDAILVLGADGAVRYANPAAERLLDARAGGLEGMRPGIPIAPLDAAAGALAARLGRPPAALEVRTCPFAWDGEAATMLSVRDARARPAPGSEAAFRAFFESSLDAVLIADDEGRYVDANPAAEALLGLPRARIVTRGIRDFMDHPAEEVEAAWRAFLRAGEQKGIARLRRGDGRPVLVDYVAKASFMPGRHLSSLRDVTERQALEDQLRHAQKMEAVGRLAGGVAHDFNNLLTAIMGYCDMALPALGPEEPVRRDMEEIRKVAVRAGELTRQLLAFSRRQVLEPRLVDVNAVVAGVEPMLRRLLREDIRLATSLAPGLGAVRADPGQIEQVIVNLAVNARDAMPDGGLLTIETREAEIDELFAQQHPGARPGPHVVLAITDDGKGMDEETRAHLFEPFFTTKPVGKGTGLGLSMVYGIVKQSGGSIWVHSEPGAGSVFQIFLPRVDAGPQRPAPGDAPALPRGTETLLLVEDEEVVRDLACRLLQGLGYRILAARHGHEALEIAEREGPAIDALITDVVMPEIGGRDLARRLERARPGLRVLYMSGYTEDAIARRGALDPGAALVLKPFTPAALCRKVREVLDAPAPPAGR